MRFSSFSRTFLLLPLTAVAALIGVAPFFSALKSSFFHDLYGEVSFAGLENYRYLLSDKGFFYSFNITIIWASLQTLIVLFTAFIIAYRIWRKARYTRVLNVALLVPWGVPVYIAVPLWRSVIHGNGEYINLLLQAPAAFIATELTAAWLSLPAAVYIILGGLKKISSSSVESAVLEGANQSCIAFEICLPLIRDVLLSLGLINFIKALKEFSVVFLMTAGGPPLLQGITERYIIGANQTLSLFLYEMFTAQQDYGISSAFSVLLSLIVLAASLIYIGSQKRDDPRWRTLLLVIPLLFQLCTGGKAALPIGSLYVLALLFPPLRKGVLLIHTIYAALLIFTVPYPASIQPALILGWIVYLLLGKAPRIRLPATPGSGVLWKFIEAVLAFLLIGAALFMCAALIRLSISQLNAISFQQLLPRDPGLESYRQLFTEEGILRYFANTLKIALVCALLLPLVCFPAAWAISRGSMKQKALSLAGLQMIGTVSGMHALIPLYKIFRYLGIIDSYWSLILIYLEHSFVFSMFTMTAFLSDFPKALRENAEIEGAGPWRFLFQILMPLSKPVISSSMMVCFLGAWNGFIPALLFIRDDIRYTIGVKIYTFVGSIASGTPQWALFAAASCVNIMVLGLFFFIHLYIGKKSELSDLHLS